MHNTGASVILSAVRKTTLAFFLCALTSNSYAGKSYTYIDLGDTNNGMHFQLERETIQKFKDGSVSFWIVTNFSDSYAANTGVARHMDYISSTCGGSMAYESKTRNYDAKGHLLDATTLPSLAMEIHPNTIFSHALKLVCETS